MNKKTIRTLILLTGIALFIVLCTTFAFASTTTYLKSDAETKQMHALMEDGKNYHDLIRLYAREFYGLERAVGLKEFSGTEEFTAGLLNYEKGNNPAFVDVTSSGDEIFFEIITPASTNPYKNEYVYTEKLQSTGFRDNRSYQIFTKDKIDYIKYSNGTYWSNGTEDGVEEHEEIYYKFDGKKLMPICEAYISTEIEYNKTDVTTGSYKINNINTTKAKYEAFIKDFKFKQSLFYFSAGSPTIRDSEKIDYQYMLDEFAKVPPMITVFPEDNPRYLKDKPIFINGTTLAPLRAVGEIMGANVKWDQMTKKITLNKGVTTIELTIGSNKAKVNGKVITLNTSPLIMDSKTYIPVRFIVESLGGGILYYSNSNEIFINFEEYLGE